MTVVATLKLESDSHSSVNKFTARQKRQMLFGLETFTFDPYAPKICSHMLCSTVPGLMAHG